MEIRTINCLHTMALWEDFLGSLPSHANGHEDLGLIWENTVPAKRVGQDPTVKQGWRLAVYKGVEFSIPDDAEIQEIAESSAGPYTLVRIGHTAIHLRNGTKITDSGRVVGDVHVNVRVIWPKDADKRQNGKAAWRNYLLFLDIFPTTESKITKELMVCEEGAKRSPLIMLGSQQEVDPNPEMEGEPDEGIVVTAWATRSANWRYGSDEGSDQCICLCPRQY
ncbi:MAG: hypothetical protein WC654_05880 [Patescibacteria group bacterium]